MAPPEEYRGSVSNTEVGWRSSRPCAPGVRHGVAPAPRRHTQAPPYEAFDLRDGGADRRVRPGQLEELTERQSGASSEVTAALPVSCQSCLAMMPGPLHARIW